MEVDDIKDDLSVLFSQIEDPRIAGRTDFPLSEILFLTIVACLVGVTSWRQVAIVGENKIELLRRYFPFANGIPSHQTIGRVFSLFKPTAFEKAFSHWTLSRIVEFSGEKQIAIDGKTLRGSHDSTHGKSAIHMLHAFAVESGLTIAQLAVPDKSNEITAVSSLLDQIDIQHAVVTVDAMNTQKDFAAHVKKQKAEYVFALKGNHKGLFEDVKMLFSDTPKSAHFTCEETDKSHGRVSERRWSLLPVDKTILPQVDEWQGLSAVGRVETTTFKAGKETFETRYYLLSIRDVKRFATSTRGHWAVESMRWILDVTFDEDLSRERKDHAPRNYALIRKFTLNAIRLAQGKKSIPNARLVACLDEKVLTTFIEAAGFKPLVS